ncbi:hypothetical protein GQ607_004566 [Colletotrichum asianum]|uniref:Uncharacterized protein n=1 Tax=Colletotrichum asianum TaxID=702518 RepID=A0A8H3WLP8_9PEZI|nr:hypothetical protein GQ607_004566 [Colletotrichum asianum]
MPGGQGWRRPVCRRLDCSRNSNNIPSGTLIVRGARWRKMSSSGSKSRGKERVHATDVQPCF